MSCRKAVFFTFSFVAFSSTVLADRMVTSTGKILEGKVTAEGENYKIQFEQVSLVIPKKLVTSVDIEGDMSTYVPKDDREKEMLTKGYVKFKGQWLTKDRYANELKLQREAVTKKLEDFKAHQSWGNEWKKETKHFLVSCNVSPEALDLYSETFENFYDSYAAKFNIKSSPAAQKEKMALRIFRDEKDYLEYSKKPGTGGYFSPGEKSLFLYHDHDDPFMSQVVLFHEGTHLINYYVNPEMFGVIPIWLEESTAEYFSHVKLETVKGKLNVIPGQIAEDRLGVAQELLSGENATKHLQKVFTTPQVDFKADLYSLGWSFVYFLMNQPKYAPGFLRFYKDIYQGQGMNFELHGKRKYISNEEVVKALLKYVGAKDLETLEREWARFVLGLTPPGGRGYYYRALVADWGDNKSDSGPDALALLNKAIDELGYKPSQAYFIRSRVLNYRGEREKAMEDLNRAIEIDPTNDRYYLIRAWTMNKQGKHAEAERDLRLAMILEPLAYDYEIYLNDVLAKKWKIPPMR